MWSRESWNLMLNKAANLEGTAYLITGHKAMKCAKGQDSDRRSQVMVAKTRKAPLNPT